MARRNFIKAYNDMVSGSGQSNVSGLNISEFANNRPFPREVDNMSRKPVMNKPYKDEPCSSQNVVNQPKLIYKPPSPSRNVQGMPGGGWSGIKPIDRNLFVDIDGESLPEAISGEGIEVVDTSHKIQRHMSLLDLTRPYVPTAPNNSAKRVPENREMERLSKNEEHVKTKTLPKGVSGSNQPYVLPKFTPTFKEMLSTRSKKDTLVSITEPTPPSMQKWAIEWNSEPKHAISIAELKEDIIREKCERGVLRNGKIKDIIFAEDERLFEEEIPQEKRAPAVPKSRGRILNTMQSRDDTEYYSSNHSESNDTHFEPSTNVEELKQVGTAQPRNIASSRTSLDWLPEKYEGMKRISKGIPNDHYSFKQAIQENVKDGTQQPIDRNKVAPVLLGTSDREVSFDEDRRQFHQWFRNRLSRRGEKNEEVNGRKNTFFGIDDSSVNPFDAAGSDPYATSGKRGGFDSVTYSYGDPTRNQSKEKPIRQNPKENAELDRQEKRSRQNPKENAELDRRGRSSSNIPDYLPPKEEVNKPVEPYPQENNSSFFYWLKQRGLINMMKRRTSERSKPPRTDDVVKPEPIFPWSTSYMCKYVPGSPANKKERNDSKKVSQPTRNNSSRTAIPLRKAVTQTKISEKRISRKKVKSQGVFQRIKTKKSGFVQEKNEHKKNRQKVNDNSSRKDMQSERIPYHGWIMGNELDHVKNLRLMENNHAAPQVMNRKKLFPSLHEQRSTSSLNYWESKFAKPLTRTKDDEFYTKEKGTQLNGTIPFDVAPGKNEKSPSKIKLVKSPDLFVDNKDFIDISDDPISSLKSLLRDPKDPTDSLLASRADDEESKISRCMVKLSQKIGKNLAGGNPTLITKVTESSKAPNKESPIHLKFALSTDNKTADGISSSRKLKDSSNKVGNEVLLRGLEADRNEVDENWLEMISPKVFNFDYDADLIQHLKRSSPECKSSSANVKKS